MPPAPQPVCKTWPNCNGISSNFSTNPDRPGWPEASTGSWSVTLAIPSALYSPYACLPSCPTGDLLFEVEYGNWMKIMNYRFCCPLKLICWLNDDCTLVFDTALSMSFRQRFSHVEPSGCLLCLIATWQLYATYGLGFSDFYSFLFRSMCWDVWSYIPPIPQFNGEQETRLAS